MDNTVLVCFIISFEEYLRFANVLKTNTASDFIVEYSETDYVSIYTRLMLLRKYYSKGQKDSHFKTIIKIAKESSPENISTFNEFENRYERTLKSNLEHILSDGENQTLFDAIEDTVYGLYLHSDKNRIIRLEKADNSLRFFCVRKFVLEFEALLRNLYEVLIDCGIKNHIVDGGEIYPVVALRTLPGTMQNVSLSPKWRNLYGHDMSRGEINRCLEELTGEDAQVYYIATAFIDELRKDLFNNFKLRKMVHPYTLLQWGNFRKAHENIKAVEAPGFSTTIRYSNDGNIAYVFGLSSVNEALLIEGEQAVPHSIVISLVKYRKKWKIYAIGNKLESVFE